MTDSNDFTSLEIVYQHATPEDVGYLRSVVEHHRDHPATHECLDLLIVILDGEADIIVPVNAHPADSVNAFSLDLFGCGQWFAVEAESLRADEHTKPGWSAFVDRIQRRNLALLQSQASITEYGRFPADAVPVTKAFRPNGRPRQRQIEILERAPRSVTHVSGGQHVLRQSRQRMLTVDLEAGDRVVQAHCVEPFAVTGSEDEFAALCFERLSQLDTGTFKDLLALIDVAYTRNTRLLGINVPQGHQGIEPGTGFATWTEIGRKRGWLDLDKKGRRQQLRSSIEALIELRFTWDYTDGDRVCRVSNVPLFYCAGIVSVPNSDRRGYLLGFNDVFWTRMVKLQRAIVYDSAILSTHTAQQDWHLWIYWAFCIRLSRSWLAQGLASNGVLEMRLRSFLSRVDYEAQLTNKGPEYLRRRVEKVLRDLARPIWNGRPLIAKYAFIMDPENILESKVKLWATQSLIQELQSHRTKAANSLALKRDRRNTPPLR